MKMQVNFRDRLIQLRKQDRKTQEQMANIINVNRVTYGSYERGTILPPYDKIEKIAHYFGVSVDYLMGNSNNKIKSETNSSNHDVNKTLSNLLHDLKDASIPLVFENHVLDDETRSLLAMSIENSLKMANVISNKNKKG